MDISIIILRILHIFGAVFWVGAAWIGALFLEPTARALGPDGGKFMAHLLNVRKYARYIMVAALVTLLAGLALFFILYGGSGFRTATGMAFAIGGGIGLIAGICGGMISAVSGRMSKLGAAFAQQGKPPTPEQGAEMAALQKRLRTLGMATAILTTIALLLMAVARNL